jgi:hypothetical protein
MNMTQKFRLVATTAITLHNLERRSHCCNVCAMSAPKRTTCMRAHSNVVLYIIFRFRKDMLELSDIVKIMLSDYGPYEV